MSLTAQPFTFFSKISMTKVPVDFILFPLTTTLTMPQRLVSPSDGAYGSTKVRENI
jgi:hypothetical protein